MDNNPYAPPPEPPNEKRKRNLLPLILAASMAAALTLVFFNAPRWLVVSAGACAALTAEEIIRRNWERD